MKRLHRTKEPTVTKARDQNNKHDKLVKQPLWQNSDCVMPWKDNTKAMTVLVWRVCCLEPAEEYLFTCDVEFEDRLSWTGMMMFFLLIFEELELVLLWKYWLKIYWRNMVLLRTKKNLIHLLKSWQGIVLIFLLKGMEFNYTKMGFNYPLKETRALKKI